jgi:hypothetical protein
LIPYENWLYSRVPVITVVVVLDRRDDAWVDEAGVDEAGVHDTFSWFEKRSLEKPRRM